MTRRPLGKAAAAAALALAACPVGARAGGLFVPGYGSQAQPRAGAFVAKADDPSALYYNPAGLAKQKGTNAHLGMNFIAFNQKFQRAGVYEATDDAPADDWTGQPYGEVENEATPAIGVGRFQGIPLFGVTTDLGGRSPVVIGLGLIADHGYPEREIEESYQFGDPNTPPPPQRYDIIEQDVSAAFPSLGAAYRIAPQVDVGVRVSWGFAGSKGRQHLWAGQNYSEDVQRDGVFAVDVADNFIPAAGAGLLYRPTPAVELGAAYHTQKNVNFKGEGQATIGSRANPAFPEDFIAPELDSPKCAGGGTVAAIKTCIDLTLPQTASLGGRYILRDVSGEERGDVELDVQWEDWSSASDITITADGKGGFTGMPLRPAVVRHGFQDTFSFRLGGSYGFDLGPDSRLEVRAGAAHDTAAAPLTWTRLDIDGMARTTLGAGFALDLASFRVELGGGVVIEGERTVPECNPGLEKLGCGAADAEAPQSERDRPDPAQPLSMSDQQVESPFNGGTYQQSYVLFSLGVGYAF